MVKFLSSKESKNFFSIVKDQWGVELKPLFKDYALASFDENKLSLISRDVELLPLDDMRLNSVGLYIAELKHDEVRLSIEGSQILGPLASKNMFEIDLDSLKSWLRGEDIDHSGETEGFIIVKYKNDFVGSGKVKEGKVLNFVPKIRRIQTSDVPF